MEETFFFPEQQTKEALLLFPNASPYDRNQDEEEIISQINELEKLMVMTEEEIKEQKEIVNGDLYAYLNNLKYNLEEDRKLVKSGMCSISFIDPE